MIIEMLILILPMNFLTLVLEVLPVHLQIIILEQPMLMMQQDSYMYGMELPGKQLVEVPAQIWTQIQQTNETQVLQ